MGAFYPGIPNELGLFFRERFNITVFVETGTYKAHTARWASTIFDKVITIELSEKLYKQNLISYGNLENIHFLYGNSVEVLRSMPVTSKAALYWLDAHWSSGVTAGERLPCPLLDEIGIILNSKNDHVLLIDDARLLALSPPHPEPHDLPPLAVVYDALNQYDRYTCIWRDVMISVPLQHASTFYNDFLRKQKDLTKLLSF